MPVEFVGDKPGNPIAAVLNGAADYLDTYGWSHGKMQDGDAVCMTQAVAKAANQLLGMRLYSPAHEALRKALDCGPTQWNDAPGRTKEEVTAKLREVAGTLT